MQILTLRVSGRLEICLLEKVTFNNYNKILINAIFSDTSYTFAQICGNLSTPKIVTNPFPQTLVSAKQNSLENKISFNLDYSFYECGGLLYGPMNTIKSPTNMSMDCAWSLIYQYGQINVTRIYALNSVNPNCLIQ
jgi:hypothetical protein